MTHIISEKDRINKDLLSEYLHLLRDSTETIYKLLEGLLTWARSQRGEIKYQPENFNLFEIVNHNIELFEATATGKNLNLNNQVNETMFIFADKEMINTIIRNLMNNAIKYSNSGGSIEVDAKDMGLHIDVWVKDYGVGMDENYLLHLFSLDSKRRSNDGTRGEKGSGLGLILCKEFMDKHKGKMGREVFSDFRYPKPKNFKTKMTN
jgi:signal transduction histidine kinase